MQDSEITPGAATAEIKRYPPDMQGRGSFDGGRITERKPIGFPGETSAQKRIGPLLYWAWAQADGYGKIGLHPHKGFEIISYVMEGEVGHYDTLGNRSRVGVGGAQVMQTGSGVMHEEETVGERTEFFQIWFEPYLQTAVTRKPTYAEFRHDDFPIVKERGASVKEVIGSSSPVHLEADARMRDVEVEQGAEYEIEMSAGRSLVAVIVNGEGVCSAGDDSEDVRFSAHDMVVVHANSSTKLQLASSDGTPLRVVMIDVPTTVNYPLYPAA